MTLFRKSLSRLLQTKSADQRSDRSLLSIGPAHLTLRYSVEDCSRFSWHL
jgi:hypothetical protein